MSKTKKEAASLKNMAPKSSKHYDTIEADIGITEKHKQAVADELNRLLSNEFLLYTKTRKFHWNVEGPQFHDLHLFFEKQYGQLAEIMDEVAERIRKIGHYALGSMKHYLAEATLLENEDHESSSESMLEQLLDDHETIIRHLRRCVDDFEEKYKDVGSADFITGLIKRHETMAWMLRATAKR